MHRPLLPAHALLLLGVACDPKLTPDSEDYARGQATACLAGDGTVSRGDDETTIFDLTGTVVSDEAASGALTGDLHPCGAVSRVFTLAGSDGATYRLGYGVWDALDADITTAMDVEADASVYLRFSSVRSFGDASGFVLQDADSVIGAVEDGTWGPALGASDFPGLSVEIGEFAGFGHNDCGDTRGSTLRFVGDAERELTPVEDKLITVDEKAYSAFAISAWEFTEYDCTDTAGETIWAVFR